jgi:hypothetical protein
MTQSDFETIFAADAPFAPANAGRGFTTPSIEEAW